MFLDSQSPKSTNIPFVIAKPASQSPPPRSAQIQTNLKNWYPFPLSLALLLRLRIANPALPRSCPSAF